MGKFPGRSRMIANVFIQMAAIHWLGFAVALLFVAGCWAAWRIGRRMWSACTQENPPTGGSVWRVTDKPWTLPELGMMTGYVLTVMVGVWALAGTVIGMIQPGYEPDPLISLVVQLAMYLALALGFTVFLYRRQYSIRSVFGLDQSYPVRAITDGLLFCVAILPVVAVAAWGTRWVYDILNMEFHLQPVVIWIQESPSKSARLALIGYAMVVAPVAEEMFFRGIAYPTLKQHLGVWPAMLTVAFVFGLIHFHTPVLVPLFVLGVGLALAYEWTGSLLTPIAMHAAFNGLNIMMFLWGIELDATSP